MKSDSEIKELSLKYYPVRLGSIGDEIEQRSKIFRIKKAKKVLKDLVEKNKSAIFVNN